MTITVRLDPKSERILARLARERRQSKSEVVRAAIDALSGPPSRTRPLSFWGSIEHLAGVAAGGPRHLSIHTGRRFTESLRRRARRR